MSGKVLTALAVVCLAAGAGPAWCGPAKAVGMAVFVRGDVKLQRPGAAEAPQLRQRDDLRLGDAVETGPEGAASLVLLYGAEIRLSGNTRLEFISGKKKGDAALLARGQVWTRMLHKRGGLNVRTPSAICAVRGTEADIEQAEQLVVKVYEGRVDVENAGGRVSLRAGEMARVAGPGAAPSKAEKMRPGDLGRWHEGITSPDIMEFLKALRAGENKKLEFNVNDRTGDEKDVKIRLKKKDGAEGN